jgi:hypothetical protein
MWTALFPASLLLRLVGLASPIPLWAAILGLALFLPARLVSYGYSALRDPVIPVPRTRGRLLGFLWHAYAGVFVGWLIQINALYLEFVAAPRRWDVTAKRIGQPLPNGPSCPR